MEALTAFHGAAQVELAVISENREFDFLAGRDAGRAEETCALGAQIEIEDPCGEALGLGSPRRYRTQLGAHAFKLKSPRFEPFITAPCALTGFFSAFIEEGVCFHFPHIPVYRLAHASG